MALGGQMGYQFKYLPQDITKRFKPLFQDEDLEIDTTEAHKPKLRRLHHKLMKRTNKLRDLIEMIKSEYNKTYQESKNSVAWNNVSVILRKVRKTADDQQRSFDELLNTLRQRQDTYRNNTRETVFGWYRDYFLSTETIHSKLFHCRALIIRAQITRDTLNYIHTARQVNKNREPQHMIPMPREPSGFGHKPREVVKELDKQIVNTMQWRDGLKKKISTVKAKLIPHKWHPTGREALNKLEICIQRDRERFNDFQKMIENLCTYQFDRMLILQVLKFVMDTFHVTLDTYANVVDIDREREGFDIPNRRNSLTQSLFDAGPEKFTRPGTYARIAQTAVTIPERSPTDTIVSSCEHQYYLNSEVEVPRAMDLVSKKSIQRKQADLEWEEPYPPPSEYRSPSVRDERRRTRP